MADIKVYRDETVVLALSEREASVLHTILMRTVHLSTCPEAAAVAELLRDVELSDNAVELTFDSSLELFQAD